jgi:hypothetical protein
MQLNYKSESKVCNSYGGEYYDFCHQLGDAVYFVKYVPVFRKKTATYSGGSISLRNVGISEFVMCYHVVFSNTNQGFFFTQSTQIYL